MLIKTILAFLLGTSLLGAEMIRVGKTVVDSETGLMWQDMMSHDTVQLPWKEARAYCRGLDWQGYRDWRLPKSKTLKTFSKHMRGTNTSPELFANLNPDFFWSSTTYLTNATEAWTIMLDVVDYSAVHSDKMSYFTVVCVRGEQK